MSPVDTRKTWSTDPGLKVVAPSLLSVDFARLADGVKQVEQAPWLHVDVMDGVFVPNISIGPVVVKALRAVTDKYLDVHLMITDPGRYIEAFAQAGADGLTVHAEACLHLHRVLQQIKSAGMRTGVALNPATPINALEWVLEDIDVILVMTVNPGFGGQRFIPSMTRKVSAVRDLVVQQGAKAIIEVDGGVDKRSIRQLSDAGANAFVAGTAVFGDPNPQKALQELYKAIDKGV